MTQTVFCRCLCIKRLMLFCMNEYTRTSFDRVSLLASL